MIRRLGPGDEELHVALAGRFKEHAPTLEQSRAFLADDRNWLLVAMDDARETVGFALAYHMPRWDGRSMVFFYEIDIDEAHRSQGYGTALVEELVRMGSAGGAYKMWVQTDEDNEPAMRLYGGRGAERTPDNVVWTWLL